MSCAPSIMFTQRGAGAQGALDAAAGASARIAEGKGKPAEAFRYA